MLIDGKRPSAEVKATLAQQGYSTGSIDRAATAARKSEELVVDSRGFPRQTFWRLGQERPGEPSNDRNPVASSPLPPDEVTGENPATARFSHVPGLQSPQSPHPRATTTQLALRDEIWDFISDDVASNGHGQG